MIEGTTYYFFYNSLEEFELLKDALVRLKKYQISDHRPDCKVNCDCREEIYEQFERGFIDRMVDKCLNSLDLPKANHVSAIFPQYSYCTKVYDNQDGEDSSADFNDYMYYKLETFLDDAIPFWCYFNAQSDEIAGFNLNIDKYYSISRNMWAKTDTMIEILKIDHPEYTIVVN